MPATAPQASLLLSLSIQVQLGCHLCLPNGQHSPHWSLKARGVGYPLVPCSAVHTSPGCGRSQGCCLSEPHSCGRSLLSTGCLQSNLIRHCRIHSNILDALSAVMKQWFPNHVLFCTKAELRQGCRGRVRGAPSSLMPQPEQQYLIKMLVKKILDWKEEILKTFGVGVILFALGRRQHRAA